MLQLRVNKRSLKALNSQLKQITLDSHSTQQYRELEVWGQACDLLRLQLCRLPSITLLPDIWLRTVMLLACSITCSCLPGCIPAVIGHGPAYGWLPSHTSAEAARKVAAGTTAKPLFRSAYMDCLAATSLRPWEERQLPQPAHTCSGADT